MGITIRYLEVLRDREKSARVSTEAYEDSRVATAPAPLVKSLRDFWLRALWW